MGLLGVDAINNRDYQMLMGLTLFTAILVLLGDLLADIMYSFVDPEFGIKGEQAWKRKE